MEMRFFLSLPIFLGAKSANRSAGQEKGKRKRLVEVATEAANDDVDATKAVDIVVDVIDPIQRPIEGILVPDISSHRTLAQYPSRDMTHYATSTPPLDAVFHDPPQE